MYKEKDTRVVLSRERTLGGREHFHSTSSIEREHNRVETVDEFYSSAILYRVQKEELRNMAVWSILILRSRLPSDSRTPEACGNLASSFVCTANVVVAVAML